MFGSGAYKEKILDDIINILDKVNKTGNSEIVEKEKHLFLGKYEAIPKLLSSILPPSITLLCLLYFSDILSIKCN